MRTEFYNFDMPLHENLSFNKWEFEAESKTDGPRISFIAGLNGDELNGLYIAWKLIRYFRENPTALKKGSIRILPAANPIATNLASHEWPFDKSDLNKMFPGYDKGETIQRIAAILFNEIKDSDYIINFHTITEMVQELPQVRLFDPNHKFEELAKEFGLKLVWKRAATHPIQKTFFSAQMGSLGIPSFAIHLGAARRMNPYLAASTFDGILHFLKSLGVIEDSPPPPNTEILVCENHNLHEVYSPDAGLFMIETQLGAELKKGDILGRIIDPITGDEALRVESPVSGLLSTIRIHPLTYEGNLLARIAVSPL